jgi:hypothetical protein
MFVKDLGHNRVKLEKKLKEDALNNSNQALWKNGPKNRK